MAVCKDCGANLALVGKRHRCRARMANTPESMANTMANTIDGMANTHTDMANTYRYRDADARRVYMRDYMRRIRAARGRERSDQEKRA